MIISNKSISIACVVLIIALIIFKQKWYSHYPDNSYGQTIVIDQETKLDSLNTKMSLLNQKLDSVKSEKKIYTDGFAFYSGFTSGLVGVVKLFKNWKGDSANQNYVYLGGFGLKINENVGPNYLTYYNKNGQGYLATTASFKKDGETHIKYLNRKVDYSYSSKDNNILLPINSVFFKYFVLGLFFLFPLGSILLCLFWLRIFTHFLLAIAKNEAFSDKNLKRLKQMTISLVVLSLYTFVVQGAIYFIFCLFYPRDGVMLTYSFWDKDYLILIFALLTYLVYTAFKQALVIQQEQDLTI